MPTPHDPKLPLRLAYSHREKAEAAMRQCDRAMRDGGVDAEHHARLRSGYERELQTAQRNIQRLIGVERARMESLEAQRRTALEEQLHLPARVAAGKISAQDANDANRRVTQRIAGLDEQIAVSRARVESRTSEELGGFIDLSFPEYVATETVSSRVVQIDAAPSATPLRDWYYTSALAIVAATAVFLPWLSKEGITSSLATAGSGLTQLAAQAGLPVGLAQFAWILFAVLPFAGIPIAAGRNARLFGWGFLLLGLLMLSCAAFPGLALGASGTGASNLMQLLTSFRIGALLYCACAVGYIVLGAFRVSPPGDSLAHATAVSLALLVAVGGIGILAAFAVLGVQGLPRVTFSAALDGASNDRVIFTVSNEGRDPIACYFPLPTGDEGVRSPVSRSHAFGLQVDVREKDRDTFSAAPPSPTLWNLAQGPVPEEQYVLVNGGAQLKGNLDLRQLSALGVDPQSVRLQLLSLGRSLVEEMEVNLDGRYLSKPGPIRDPLIITPPPPRTASASELAALPAVPAAQETPAPAEKLRVEFTGVIGGRAIIRVYTGNGSRYDDVIAGPGEPVAEGWVLESVVRQPGSVTMNHTKSGTNVQVIRGHVVEIAPNPGG